MASTDGLEVVTLEAGADLSAKQYHFVLVAADGQIDAVSSGGGDSDGVLQNDPNAAGEPATVGWGGITKIVAGAAMTKGAKVQSNASGRAITAASADHVLGKLLDTAAADGDIVRILLGSPHILA